MEYFDKAIFATEVFSVRIKQTAKKYDAKSTPSYLRSRQYLPESSSMIQLRRIVATHFECSQKLRPEKWMN